MAEVRPEQQMTRKVMLRQHRDGAREKGESRAQGVCEGHVPAHQEGANPHNVSDAGGRWGGGWQGEDPPRAGGTLWRWPCTSLEP